MSTVLVDGGDAFLPTPGRKPPEGTRLRAVLRDARTVIRAYDILGYRAVAVGPSDLQLGVDRFRDLVGDASFEMLCANLVRTDTGEPVFRPSMVVEVKGVRIGLYGVLLDSLSPGYRERALQDGTYDILDPLTASRRVVEDLRPRCDVLVALSHLDIPQNYRVAREVEGIDAIVDPYSQSGNKAVWVAEGKYVLERGGTSVLRIDGQGSRVGVFEMEVATGDGPGKLVGSEGYDYPLEPHITDHPWMRRLVEDARRGSTYRWPDPDHEPHAVNLLTGSYLGDAGCGACHEEQLAFWRDTRHATAYESLLATGTQERYDCIECHTTGYGLAFVDVAGVGDFRGVQCESCHGVLPGHAENPARHRFGKVPEGPCWGCHNEDITDRPFDYEGALEKVSCPEME